MEAVPLPHERVSDLEDGTLGRKVLSKFSRNNKFNSTVSFNFILSTS